MRPMLEACDLSFSYGENEILRNVSLSVQAGRTCGLLGPNGAGKSTLLSLLAGDLRPSSGTVRLAGNALSEYDRKALARVRSVMPQASDFPFSYLVRDIVAMGRTCWSGVSRENDSEVIEAAMEKTDVAHMADREVTRLSGGEKARVTLARVVAQDSHIVFLDEPTAALDIAHQERTMELCRELAQAGNGVIAVMHDLQLAGAYCDDVAVMNGGEIVAFGPPREVLTSQLLSSVYQWPIRVVHLETGELAVLPDRS